ncbi:hypothetical protein ACQCP0_05710 [Ralstonia pseudosolanacearum]|uniref:Uncharacterized protein n=5 Tax=Ralstonia solanacearum species complex TaxID=3116862 RepID=A0A0S4U6F3_RALSL|nr:MULTISPECIES: hypothetical protein [Ralstonia]APC67961.1 hypothetical protein RSOE_12610 [Ralstonia solanacearum OE1-1]APF87773.1 hypothetical protein BCR16_13650 [Ralstonia solanacearum FJAT-1458]ARS55478.1 hypothetical protein BC427_04735 [Ralstonia solanacearum FJAT-91]AXV96417.1 hypothetical protein CJO80_13040 [Ralstonia solanacearum]API75402.1 hypothetical protein AC251_13050 [Ralstonia pseudosolanacearum]
MPLPLILAGMAVEELVVWGLGLLATSYVAANAAKGTAKVLQQAMENAQSTPTTQTDTTTIVGKGRMDCGDGGKYGDMLKKTGNGKLDRDHVPSKAALQQAARDLLKEAGIKLKAGQEAALFGDNGLIAKEGRAIAIPKKDHQQHSETYGRRNSPEKINGDAKDLQKAAERDTKTIEDAEGKEMDDECAEKYKKEADDIRKKTHAEYMQDLKKLIKNVMQNVKD